MKFNNELYKIHEISNFREMINATVEKYPNNVAYKFKKNVSKKDNTVIEKTYKEIKHEIECFSTALLDLNLENKKIAVISNNRYEWCVTYLAATTGNMVIVPLDKALPDGEIKNLIKISEADCVVYENKYSKIFDEIKNSDENKNLKIFINMDLNKDENGIRSFQQLKEYGEKLINEGNDYYNKISLDNEKMSALLFTSGTTSKPKGVMLSQKNICSNIMAMAKMSKIYSKDVLLSFLPLHHTFECTITFLYGFYSGATVAFCDGLKYISKNLQEYKVSVIVAVPLVLETIYKKIENGIEKSGKKDKIKKISKITNFLYKYLHIDIRRKIFKSVLEQLGGHVRILYFGAAAMNKQVIDGYNTFGISTVQGYGLTETSPLIAAETDKQKRPGSVGRNPFNVELDLIDVDEDGVGEIIAKGPNVMLGYYHNEDATKQVLEDGWFHTGDLGYFDEDGFLFITGRKKEVIVLKNGENVFPADIEFLVNSLPYVKESILFPRENSKNEINLGIKVVYDEKLIKENFINSHESEYEKLVWEDIKEINKSLPVFKKIKELIITQEPLEKTTTQKIKRFKEFEKILGKKQKNSK